MTESSFQLINNNLIKVKNIKPINYIDTDGTAKRLTEKAERTTEFIPVNNEYTYNGTLTLKELSDDFVLAILYYDYKKAFIRSDVYEITKLKDGASISDYTVDISPYINFKANNLNEAYIRLSFTSYNQFKSLNLYLESNIPEEIMELRTKIAKLHNQLDTFNSTMTNDLAETSRELTRKIDELKDLTEQERNKLKTDILAQVGNINSGADAINKKLTELFNITSVNRDAITKVNADIDAAKNQIHALNEAINNNTASDAELLEAIKNNREAIDNLLNTVNEINSKITAIIVHNKDVDHSVELLNEKDTELEGKITTNKESINSLNTSVSEHGTSIENLINTTSEHTNKLTDVDNTLASHLESINSNKASITETANNLKTFIQTVADNTDKIVKNIGNLNTVSTTNAKNIERHEGELADIKTKLEDAKTALDNAKSELEESINSDKEALEGKISEIITTTLPEAIKGVTDSVTELSTKVENYHDELVASNTALDTKLTTSINNNKAEILGNINTTKSELENIINTNESDIEDKVSKLSDTVTANKTDADTKLAKHDSDITGLTQNLVTVSETVRNELNTAKEDLKKYSDDANDALDNKLSSIIDNKDTTINAKVDKVKEDLTQSIQESKTELTTYSDGKNEELETKLTKLINDNAKGDSDALNSAKQELVTKLTELETKIKEEDIKPVSDSLNELKEAYEAFNTEATTKLADLTKNDTTLFNKLGSDKAELTDLINSNVTTLNGKIGDLTTKNSDLEANYNSLNNSVGQNTNSITDLASKAKETTTTVTNINTRLTAEEKSLADLQKAQRADSDNIATISSKVDDHTSKINDINTKLESQKADSTAGLDQLRTDLNGTNDDVTALTSRVSTSETEIDGLAENIDANTKLINDNKTASDTAHTELEKKIQANTSGIESLNENLKTANTTINNVNTNTNARVDEVNTEIGKLKEYNTNNNEFLKNLTNTINTADSKVLADSSKYTDAEIAKVNATLSTKEQALKDKITDSTNNAETLVNNLSKQVSGIDTKVEVNKEAINTLKTTSLEDIKKQIANTTTGLSQANQLIQDAKDKHTDDIDKVRDSIHTQIAQFSTSNSAELARLQESVNTQIQTVLQALNSSDKSDVITNEQLKILQQSIKSINDNITNIKENITGTEIPLISQPLPGSEDEDTPATTIISAVHSLKQRVKSLINDVNGYDEKINNATSKTDGFSERINSVVEQMSNVSGQFAALSASVNTGLSSIDTKLADAKTEVKEDAASKYATKEELATVSTGLQNANTTIEGHTTKLESVNTSIEGINTNLAKKINSEDVDTKISTAIQPVSDKATELETSLNGYKTSNDKALADTKADITSLTSRVTTNENTIKSLYTTGEDENPGIVNNLQSSLDSYKTSNDKALADTNARIDGLPEVDVSDLATKESLNGVSNKVTSLESSHNTLSDTVNTVNTNLTTLSNKVDKNVNDIQSVNTNLAALNEKVPAVQTELTEFKKHAGETFATKTEIPVVPTDYVSSKKLSSELQSVLGKYTKQVEDSDETELAPYDSTHTVTDEIKGVSNTIGSLSEELSPLYRAVFGKNDRGLAATTYDGSESKNLNKSIDDLNHKVDTKASSSEVSENYVRKDSQLVTTDIPAYVGRITNLESTVNGPDTQDGSIKKYVKDELTAIDTNHKTLLDKKANASDVESTYAKKTDIPDLTNLNGKVSANETAISLLNADESTKNSVDNKIKTLNDRLVGSINAKANASDVESTYAKKTDIPDLTNLNNKTSANETAISVLNADENTTNSVDNKIKTLRDQLVGSINTKANASDLNSLATKESVNDLTTKVNGNTTKLNTLSADKDTEGSVDYKVAQLKNELNPKFDLYTTLTAFNELTKRITTLETELANTKRELSDAKAELATLNGEEDGSITQRINSAIATKANTSDVNTMVTNVTNKVTELGGNVDKKIADLGMDALKKQVQSNTSSITTHEGKIQTLTTGLETTNGNVTKAQNTANTAVANARSAQEKADEGHTLATQANQGITTLNDHVTETKNQLTEQINAANTLASDAKTTATTAKEGADRANTWITNTENEMTESFNELKQTAKKLGVSDEKIQEIENS